MSRKETAHDVDLCRPLIRGRHRGITLRAETDSPHRRRVDVRGIGDAGAPRKHSGSCPAEHGTPRHIAGERKVIVHSASPFSADRTSASGEAVSFAPGLRGSSNRNTAVSPLTPHASRSPP